jgi:hypothetical protein
LGGGCQERLELRGTVDIRWVSPRRGESSQGLGDIAARIVPGKVLAKLSDHAEAVGAGAWGQVEKALLVTVCDLSGHTRLVQLLLE